MDEIDEGRRDTQKHINHPIGVNENSNIYKAGVITSLWKVTSERKRERKKFRIVQIDLYTYQINKDISNIWNFEYKYSFVTSQCGLKSEINH